MNRVVALVPLILILGFACSAEAAAPESAEPAWNSTAGAEQAAKVMGVSTAQAAEDLAVQHEAFHTIEKLMEAGDNVWFDNKTATIHVYGSAKAAATVAIPSSVSSHIVHDSAPHPSPVSSGPIAKARKGPSKWPVAFGVR